jgi:chemotaxis signal transduction protein
MANTHGSTEALHVVLPKNITHQSLAFALAKFAAAAGYNPRCILPPMLQDRQGVVNLRGDIYLCN